MNNIIIAVPAIIGTILIYIFSIKIHKRYNYPFTLPILIATCLIILILLLTNVPYDTYMSGGNWISELLGPAVVALAYPLYKERMVLKNLLIPILSGTLVGSLFGVVTGVLLTKGFGFDAEIIYTISSKSVTTPVSMAITESLGGIVPLAAVFVMIAGISGGVLSKYVFTFIGIHHHLSKGIALGSSSHAIGTATALESSDLEGSISSIAMIISAMAVSVMTPWLLTILI
ncbi:LrgB family protein [Oceanobacillus piezotolerans]|uniref:LrgB family protein n=1 Tax=Oceanobacillus piezotolerans TaxID=2448030 RepID=A0A498D5Q0_9BACI|nr:LrgB family protein [Oceanobacillus piezotolerans]RLL42730.1 LrgB family protein [Oceanobacillus piezotolerans]